MPIDPNQQKEQFSIAYFRAVAAAAGYNVYKPEVDDSSVDWGIKGYRVNGMRYIPQLELQLKCTANDEYLDSNIINFDLRQKNYNDLCDAELIIPRILVVVIVPNNGQQWLIQTEEHSKLKYCGYWHSLDGQPPIQRTQRRIYLNRTSVFNVTQLQRIMQAIGETRRLP